MRWMRCYKKAISSSVSLRLPPSPTGEGIFSFPHPRSVCSPLYQRNALYIIHPIGMVYHRGFALYIIRRRRYIIKASPCIDPPLRYDRSMHKAVIIQNPPQNGQFVNRPYKRYSTHEAVTFHNPTLEALLCLPLRGKGDRLRWMRCYKKANSSSVSLRLPPVSLRLGHRTALALLMQFTTVLPLRYPLEKAFSHFRTFDPSALYCRGDSRIARSVAV